MAKRLILLNSWLCSNGLKDLHIEHVHIKDRNEIIVKNKELDNVKALLNSGKTDAVLKKVKNARRFETIALKHIDGYYEPTFTCVCRGCGKNFTSHVKEAVWCSAKCHSDYRKTHKKPKETA